MKIICLGDSITGHSNLEAYLKWSHILECMLEARVGPGRIWVLNRGRGGDTTADVIARLSKDVIDEKPKADIVIILIGGNDAMRGVDKAVTRANLMEILFKVQTIGAKILLMTYPLIVNSDDAGSAWVKLIDNNALIEEVAKTRGIPVLSMMQPMHTALRMQRAAELVSPKDGVHLNPGGELVFARSIRAFKGTCHALSVAWTNGNVRF